MTEIKSAPQRNALLDKWSRLGGFAAGRFLFSVTLGWKIPYSGSIGARVVELRPGHVCLTLADRRSVRNHLESIHAVALVNLGEITTGLAVFSTTSDAMRGILVDIHAEYLKKARGKLLSRAEFGLPENLADNTPCKVEARIEDQAGDTVCIVTATWLLGYRET